MAKYQDIQKRLTEIEKVNLVVNKGGICCMARDAGIDIPMGSLDAQAGFAITELAKKWRQQYDAEKEKSETNCRAEK